MTEWHVAECSERLLYSTRTLFQLVEPYLLNRTSRSWNWVHPPPTHVVFILTLDEISELLDTVSDATDTVFLTFDETSELSDTLSDATETAFLTFDEISELFDTLSDATDAFPPGTSSVD
mmetsp:Transcript_12337/g.26651  ORF Transcript_12337/g.26651 Transcript_12337/m.26651 type:complete len:120 (+) Transcript_12337:1407-1766(+)